MGDAKKISGALSEGTVVVSSTARYVVSRVLGAGGFGITYKVIRQSDGLIFALKEYFPDKLCERGDGDTMSYLKTNAQTIETGLHDFITEARRLNRENISHPNIVSVGEVFRTNNTAYYAMEYIDGCNLRQYVKNNGGKPLTVEEALSVMRPVLQAVSVIHGHMLTHLDIKHENIILTVEDNDSLRPVLIDFGQSKHYDKKGNATSQLTNAGCSEGFSPPEQYLGLYEFTPQADVYALCATLLYLLTGKQPVKSSEISATVITGMLGEDIPAHIVNAIISGMRKDKVDRTSSVELLAKNLGVDISSENHEGNVTRLLARHKRGKKFVFHRISKYSLTAILVAGGIALTVGLVWLANRQSRTQEELLTLAIETNNCAELLRFANKDSVRAFLPYARCMVDSLNYEEASKFAIKALACPGDSIEATLLIEKINGLKETKQPADNHNTDNGMSDIIPETEDGVLDAIHRNNFGELRRFAEDGEVRTFYPLAKLYFKREDYEKARYWADKAINAKTDVEVSRNLIHEINKKDRERIVSTGHTPAPSPDNSQPYNEDNSKSQASRLEEAIKDPFKGAGMLLKLAVHENYIPAYYHYARQQLKSGDISGAREYLKMSIESGVNVKQCQELLEVLDE